MSQRKHKIPELLDMMKSGVHFGHTTSRWHPKMEPYIFGVRQGIHIIDLEQTAKYLNQALDFIFDTVASGKDILWIGTKKQARDIVKKYAVETASPYVTNKWLGGTFTNFTVVQGLVKKLESLEEQRNSGKLEKYTKKEQLDFEREIERLEDLIGGIRTMKTLPGAVFMVDLKEDKTPRLESHKTGIPIVSVVDTNINPKNIDYLIPGNDDAIRSLELFCAQVAATITEARAVYEKRKAENTALEAKQPVKKQSK